MGTVWFLLMLVAAGGLIGSYTGERKDAVWSKPLSFASILLALVGAVGFSFSSSENEELKHRKILAAEHAYTRVSSEKLGRYLAERHKGKDILIVRPFSFQLRKEEQAALMAGLKQGLGDQLGRMVLHDPTYPPEIEPLIRRYEQTGIAGRLPPLRTWYNAAYFDQLIEQRALGIEIVISLIGLPEDVMDMKFWKLEDRPKLALWGGPIHRLRVPIEAGVVIAAVRRRPNPQLVKGDPPKDLDTAFDQRFLLITPQNISTIRNTYTGMFVDPIPTAAKNQ